MNREIVEECKKYGADTAALLAFIEVETGGIGFDQKTGRILIQFEPVWFKRIAPYAPSGKWSVNRVDVQSKEWEAFNDAFKRNAEAAMKSTSIGLGQIMGFNFARLGYKSVGAMWDDAKSGIAAQVAQIVKYIETDNTLLSALRSGDWDCVAKRYNGKGYKDIARKYGREPYDISMRKAYEIYKDLLSNNLKN